LNRYSRNLPLLEKQDHISEKGYDIDSSIYSGVISGIVFELQGYLAQNPENIIVFTGGDAIYFAKRMKNSIFVVCNLVLMGLALIALEYD
jgi:type III pantothenate kinase